MFLIENPSPTKKFALNVETLTNQSQTYTDVYGFKMSVTSGTILIGTYQYPKAGDNGTLAGFGILDSVQIGSITVDATNGVCDVQYLTEIV